MFCLARYLRYRAGEATREDVRQHEHDDQAHGRDNEKQVDDDVYRVTRGRDDGADVEVNGLVAGGVVLDKAVDVGVILLVTTAGKANCVLLLVLEHVHKEADGEDEVLLVGDARGRKAHLVHVARDCRVLGENYDVAVVDDGELE